MALRSIPAVRGGRGRPGKVTKAGPGDFMDLGFRRSESGWINGVIAHSKANRGSVLENSLDVGIFRGIKHPKSNLEVSHIALIQEFGSVNSDGTVIPPRPWFQSVRHDLAKASQRVLTKRWTSHLYVKYAKTRPELRKWTPTAKTKAQKKKRVYRPIDPAEALTDPKITREWGNAMVSVLKNSITTFDDPANAPSTVRRKGFNNPLIETGFMRDSVDWRVSRGVRRVRVGGAYGNTGVGGKTRFV